MRKTWTLEETWTREDSSGQLIEECEIVIGFDFEPGQKEIIYADPDRCQEGIRPSATMISAKRLDTGEDIPLSSFTKAQMERWEEDALIERLNEYSEYYDDF